MANQRIDQLKSKSKYFAVNAYLVAKKLTGPIVRLVVIQYHPRGEVRRYVIVKA